MWDAKERLDADMQYAIRMVQTHYATVEQAATMCGLEARALKEQLARFLPRAQVSGTEPQSYSLHRHIPGAY